LNTFGIRYEVQVFVSKNMARLVAVSVSHVAAQNI